MEWATAFSTIVGLIASFKSENRAQANDEYNDFLEWLGEKRHDEIISLLNINTKASISIKALLNQDRATLLDKLEAIDKMLATISSQIGGFSELAHAIKPGFELSDQAMEILRQMENGQSSAFLKVTFLSGETVMQAFDGRTGEINYNEPRFLEDDLNTLVATGMLMKSHNKNGDSVYRITRQASKLVNLSIQIQA